ncbi:MAG: indole-3-glycerol phosphate synthase TrpC [Acidimicrobiales bacterium]
MTSYLDAIAAFHRRRLESDRRDPEALAAAARSVADPPRSFTAAILAARAARAPALVAEIKRRSPSRGDLAPGLDAGRLAGDYAEGGASCLSVLTEAEHFAGSPDDLAQARSATALPVLRKDFTLSPRDVFDARIMGADAVLLIVALLDEAELLECLRAATELNMAPLVEVHDEGEAARALDAGADLIGVNQRDLRSFEVDPDRALALRSALGTDLLTVAESGIASGGDVARLWAAGYDAVLVGEALLTSGDPAGAVRALLGAAHTPPALLGGAHTAGAQVADGPGTLREDRPEACS